MKKLICAAAMSALCATVFAIESENIVGYQQISIPTGYSIYTVTFQNVTGGNYSVQDIIALDADGNALTSTSLRLQKCDVDGTFLTSLTYKKAKGGWCQGVSTLSDATLYDGEAVSLYNNTGDIVKLQVSGAVSLDPWSGIIPVGYNLIGNMTPNTISIQDMVPYYADTNEVVSENVIRLQKCGPDGTFLTSITYKQGKGGWCKGVSTLSTESFEPGEAASLYNGSTRAIKLKYKSPITAE